MSELVGRLSVLQVLLAERHLDHHATVREAIGELDRLQSELTRANLAMQSIIETADRDHKRIDAIEALLGPSRNSVDIDMEPDGKVRIADPETCCHHGRTLREAIDELTSYRQANPLPGQDTAEGEG